MTVPLDPNASVDDPALPGTTTVPPADPAAAASANADLQAAIDGVVEQLRSGAQALASAVPPPMQQRPDPSQQFGPAALDSIAREHGAGAAFSAYTQNVLLPAQMANITAAATLNRRLAERDPDIGPLLKRFGKQVQERIQNLGISDAYLAQNGWEGIVRSVAAEDPAFLEEKANAIADRKIAERSRPAPSKIEGVQTAPTGGIPAAPMSREAQIAAVKVSQDEVQVATVLYGMTESDLKQQRLEIAEQEQRFGTMGLKQAGGIPICDLSDIFDGGGGRR